MSDERIKRLTELARRVWPDREDVVALTHVDGSASVVWRTILPSIRLDGVASDDRPMTTAIRIPPHARAIDALEAGLMVMNGESFCWGSPVEWIKRKQRFIEALVAERSKLLAYVTAMADEWEREASDRPPGGQQVTDLLSPSAKRQLRECAAQLRYVARKP